MTTARRRARVASSGSQRAPIPAELLVCDVDAWADAEPRPHGLAELVSAARWPEMRARARWNAARRAWAAEHGYGRRELHDATRRALDALPFERLDHDPLPAGDLLPAGASSSADRPGSDTTKETTP